MRDRTAPVDDVSLMTAQHFVEHYPGRLLRLPEIVRVTGLSKSTIYEHIKVGAFPRGVQLGPRAVAWRAGDIDAWIASRPEARRS